MRYNHFDMLPLRAFKPLGKIMTLEGGGKDAPDTPDYTAAANAQAAGNLRLARLTTNANRPNEYTPLGSRTWEQGTGFDQVGYDQAMKNYDKQMVAFNASLKPDGTYGMNGPAKPDRQRYIQNPDDWTSNINLTPEGQRLFDSDLGLKQRYSDLANQGFDAVARAMANPEIDQSKLVKNPIDPGQSVLDAYQSRMEPMFQRKQDALEAQMANQGIFRGSKAWNEGIDELNRSRNDASIQAAKESIAQGLNARQQGLQEQSYIMDRPLNTVNALRSGSQVAMPQFQAFAQQQQTAGPDLMGAAQQQYGSGLDAYNAKVGSSSGLMNGLFSLGAAYLTGGASAAAGAGAAQIV